ncbi:MAG: hypothetical protein IJ326_07720 [Lachnospiraceae bacterium]|nr:hypothetical protein [Lachnospiraceae bacterium]
MKVHLLYEDKEWIGIGRYRDAGNIVQDLGLKTLFSISAKDVVYKENSQDTVAHIEQEDLFLKQTMESVMLSPLQTEAQIVYRHEILQDAFHNEELIRKLYSKVDELLKTWDTLGRRVTSKNNKDSAARLISDIQILKLFVTTLSDIKRMLAEERQRLTSKGLTGFYERLCDEFPEEKEIAFQKILKDISFYTKDTDGEQRARIDAKPRIVLGCNLMQGLKCNDFVLDEVSTKLKRFGFDSVKEKMKEYLYTQQSTAIVLKNDENIQKQADDLEYGVVRYVVSACAPFVLSLNEFFDQLHFQLGFYRAALNMKHHIKRFYLPYCFPKVVKQDELCFENLKEFVMAVEQRITPVGNTCDIRERMLLVITGANQGGKSTFLRSIGIAQIMMQCGLPVIAAKYESGIFPSFFTHFTRREDSAMNSGRLDEELNRMSQIIDNLESNSMVLLNESFATTTEKEGSIIAYDIIKALIEAYVKVLTVTHLLSFAQRIYQESKESKETNIEFFSAERAEKGRRTYHMIQHEPELTSFGMDLYERIIGK